MDTITSGEVKPQYKGENKVAEYISKEQVKMMIMSIDELPVPVREKYAREVDSQNGKNIKFGKWEKAQMGYLCCSECRNCYILPEWIDEGKWNFCANCGADLMGVYER